MKKTDAVAEPAKPRVKRLSAFERMFEEPVSFGEVGDVMSFAKFPTEPEARAAYAVWNGDPIDGAAMQSLTFERGFVRYGYPPTEVRDDVGLMHGESCWFGPINYEAHGNKEVWFVHSGPSINEVSTR